MKYQTGEGDCISSSFELIMTVVNIRRPIRRDIAKKTGVTKFVINKVTERVASAVPTQETPSTSLKTMGDGLSKADEVIQSMSNHHVVVMDPPDIHEQSSMKFLMSYMHRQGTRGCFSK